MREILRIILWDSSCENRIRESAAGCAPHQGILVALFERRQSHMIAPLSGFQIGAGAKANLDKLNLQSSSRTSASPAIPLNRADYSPSADRVLSELSDDIVDRNAKRQSLLW